LRIYADTSFLLSLYTLDGNSAAAARAMGAFGGERFISILGELEAFNALGLRVFRNEITTAQAQSSLNDFEKDLHDGVFQLRALPDPVFDRARELSRRTAAKLGTRTADLLHVAAALELGVECLFSFDKRQRALAKVVRLKLN